MTLEAAVAIAKQTARSVRKPLLTDVSVEPGKVLQLRVLTRPKMKSPAVPEETSESVRIQYAEAWTTREFGDLCRRWWRMLAERIRVSR